MTPTPQNPTQKPVFRLVAKDIKRDSESWSFMAVIHFTGDLATDEDMPRTVSEAQIHEIYAFVAAHGLHIQSAGSGGAGRRFADEPLLQWYPSHILLTQHGGLDV